MPIIFLADDHPHNLEAIAGPIRKILAKPPVIENYEILSAFSVIEGAQMLKECRDQGKIVDIAILDAIIAFAPDGKFTREQADDMLEALKKGSVDLAHKSLFPSLESTFPQAMAIRCSNGKGLYESENEHGREYRLRTGRHIASPFQGNEIALLVRDWIEKPETRKREPHTSISIHETYGRRALRENPDRSLIGRMRDGLEFD
jgi:hypothetical protein